MTHPGQMCKSAIVIAPVEIGTDEVTGTFDTLGARAVRVNFIMATQAATNVITTMSLAEGSATNSFTALAAFEGGGVGGFTLPAPNTTSGDIVSFFVDVTPRKRYLQVGLAHTAARISGVTAELWHQDEMPSSNTEAGLAASVIG